MSKLRHGSTVNEVDGAAMALLTSLKECTIKDDAHLTSLQAELADLSGRLNAAVKRDKYLSQLDKKDGERDDSLLSLFNLAHAYALSHAYADDADQVVRIMNKYKGLSLKPYEAETSLVESMYTDLTTDAMTTVTAKLPGFDSLLAAMRTAQDDFHTEFVTYKQMIGNLPKNGSATELKKQMIAFVNNRLTVYVEAMATVDPGKYGTIDNTMNKIIDDNNQIIHHPKKEAETENQAS